MILPPRSRCVIVFAWVVAITNVRAPADVVWSGLGLNSNWTTPANWQGDVAPANDGTEQIRFDGGARAAVLVNTSQSIRRLRFDFSSGEPLAYSLLGSTTTLTLGSDGIEMISGGTVAAGTATRAASGSLLTTAVISSPGGVVTFDSSLGLVLGASQTWSVDPASALHVGSAVSGSGPLTLTGGGYVGMSGNNTYSGGTVLQSGALGIDHDSALGSGALTIDGTATIFSSSGPRVLANALNLNSTLLNLLPYGGDFRFTGPVTLGANVTLRNDGQIVYFNGAIGEAGGSRALTLSGTSGVILSGVNSYTGGTSVLAGGLFFSNASAVPATGALSSAPPGYVGIGFNTGVQSGFIAKFAPLSTFGTIGFDSAPGATSAAIFAEPVDLSAMNAFARLGTATRATLSSTAVISPFAIAGYRFGDGGGMLKVESKFTGANSLTVDSSATGHPLTLWVAGTGNDYTGLTSVTDSALVFGAGSISSGSANGSYFLGSGGYIGSMDAGLTSWLGKFSPTASAGVIGFDSVDVNNPRSLIGTFDLSPFVAGTDIVLGSSTAAILSGSITLPALQTHFHFTGYKGGWLTVDAVLTGARAVRIGSASGDYPEFDPADLARMSTVFLNGSNSHTAGTTLFSGRLVVGDANALGTGALTVDGNGTRVEPRFETLLTSSPTFANQLVVKSDFQMGGVNPLTWSGAIVDGTSTGKVRKHGPANLTLSGNNAGFSGGFTVDEGTLTFASNTAAGTGGLDLGFSSGLAAFTAIAPSVTQLSSQSTTSRVSIASGTTLTINQASDSIFRGQIQGSGGIVKAGTGALRLETAGSFTGATTIAAGTLDVASTGALGNNTITLNGATSNLKIEPGVTLANPLVFGAAGGQLSGHGTFSSNVVLGTNSVIAPGSSVGTLTFASGLTLASGGSYDFEVQNALGGPGTGWDYVQVGGTLTFTATPTLPFTLNLISLNNSGASGNTANFSGANAYSWTIASATSFVGFNPAAFTIDTSAFTSSLNGGLFSLSTSGGNLQLNFTPVPEPSTWVLLLAGLGIVGYRKFRRRS